MCPSGHRSPAPPSPAAMMPGFRPAFDVLDADRDGKISREDLRAFYPGFSRIGSADGEGDDVIGIMISAADSNKDGFVEYDEFEKVLGCRIDRAPGGSVMAEVFRVMDRDGDGKVGLEDLRGYSKWAGFSFSDDDLAAMIKLGGGDEPDGVSFDGLLRILAVDRFY